MKTSVAIWSILPVKTRIWGGNLVHRLWTALVAIAVALLSTAGFAQETGRHALLIGNQGYIDAVGPLKNPHNDVALVGRALSDVGFRVLKPVKDAAREDMLIAVHALADALRRAGKGAVGFLYYTGHGIAVGGDNVLIPINARGTNDVELSVRGVKLTEVLDILKREAPDAVHFVVLDACRNTIRGQRGGKGFSPVNDQRTGIVLAFATAAGDTASDEGASGGPYAAALADEIVKPGQNDQAVFNAVRSRVVAETGTQIPWTHDGLVGNRIVFKPGAERVTQEPQGQPSLLQEAERLWPTVKDSTDIAALTAFVSRYGNTFYGDRAKARLAELKRLEQERSAAAAAKKKADDAARAEAVKKKPAEDAKVPVYAKKAPTIEKPPSQQGSSTDVTVICANEKRSGSCSNAHRICVKGCIDRGRSTSCPNECDSARDMCLQTGDWKTTGCIGFGLKKQ